MCSTSNVNNALQGVKAGQAASILPSIAAHQIRQHREKYLVVDVREADEVANKAFEAADVHMTLGDIVHDASALLDDTKKKTLVTVCEKGMRAELAAQSILQQASSSSQVSVAVLQRGIVGWNLPAAIIPDFVVVLGVASPTEHTEQLSLALAACAAAVDRHQNVVLVLMSQGVQWFVKSEGNMANIPNVEDIFHGEPFKPAKAMLTKFLSKGGLVLACTTCVKHRKLSFENDMMDCVHPMQMPDLVRMLGEAKGGTLQFL